MVDFRRIIWTMLLLLLGNLGSVGWASEPPALSQDPLATEVTTPNQKHLTKYRNRNYNFCFEYPASWGIYQGFDGNGVSLYPLPKPQSTSQPTIGVGGSVGQPSERGRANLQTLKEDFESRLQATRAGPNPAINLKVLNSEITTMRGLPTIVSTVEFDRGTPMQEWALKQILIHTGDDAVTYHLSLSCCPEDLLALGRAFNEVVIGRFVS